MSAAKDRTLAAAGLITTYGFLIGYTDNHVVTIAGEVGLWQFHFTRTMMVAGILAVLALPLGLAIRPKRWRGVLARSAIHGLSMVIYFWALAQLDVALVAAGLFTAPLWILLINRLAFGNPIGGWEALAVGTGFAGVLLVLGPEALSGASLPAVLPILAGALYGLGNIATRAWCAGESAVTLTTGFFAALGVIGLIGMAVLWALGGTVPPGPEHFAFRGPVWPSSTFYFWTFVQAAGSLLGVGLAVRAYQLTEASRASVLEYVILPASAFWTYVIWGKTLGGTQIGGIALIIAAGVLIALAPKSAPQN